MLPLQQQDSRPCTASRSGENACWAGGIPTKTLLRESGSRSFRGWRPIRNGAAATFSGSCSAALQDAINRYKSARESRGMRKIRASLLETREEQWQEEVIRGPSRPPVE